MIKFGTIHARDVIAAIVLIVIFALFAKGYNSWLQGLGALIIGYYFSKRVYEENHKD